MSGNGDGGLTDALAVLIRDFDHQRFTEGFLARIDKPELADAVAAAHGATIAFGADMLPAYTDHVLPILQKRHLVEHVRDQLRDDRRLIINASPLLGKDRAASLNQVMVLALVEASKESDGLLSLMSRAIGDVKQESNTFDVFGKEPDTSSAGRFDNVVLRHGPAKADRYEAVKPMFDAFMAHHSALCAANPLLRAPPRLHPETFDHFDALLAERASSAQQKTVAKEAASIRKRTIRLGWDVANHIPIQQGARSLAEIAETIDTLAEEWTIVFVAPPASLGGYFDILKRLRRASGGKLRVAANESVHAEWVSREPAIGKIYAAPSPYPPAAIAPLEVLENALDAALLRLLSAGVAAATAGSCAELGKIHPTIADKLSATWADWRTAIDANNGLRRDFLSLLHRVELSGTADKESWDGDADNVGRLVAGLVLMLATNAGKALAPEIRPGGNLLFEGTGVALGSGCREIGERRISDFGDPALWDADALILSHGEEGMFISDELMTEAGEPPTSLTRARRLPPVLIPGSKKWRTLLGGDIAEWSEAVRAEFDGWQKRRKEAAEAPHA